MKNIVEGMALKTPQAFGMTKILLKPDHLFLYPSALAIYSWEKLNPVKYVQLTCFMFATLYIRLFVQNLQTNQVKPTFIYKAIL